jgi:glycolate oxidase FAD binding subunit
LNAVERLSARLRDAAAHATPLRIEGSGSKSFYGMPSVGEPLDTRGVTGIVSYEPTELVIQARAGTPLVEIEALLKKSNQMLAFEPPHFGPNATLGGSIAAGLSGPARGSAGSARDFVLGATVLDGHGQLLTFGGQVMKNVAGYDIPRVLTGSLGTLGILIDVSLKVLPLPIATESHEIECSLADALNRFQELGTRSMPVTATAWHDGRATVRIAGSQAAIDAAAKLLHGRRLEDEAGRELWHALREQTHEFFAGDSPLWRVALPVGVPPLGFGDELVEWRGMQRWLRSSEDGAAIRSRAISLGGHATLFRGPDSDRAEHGVFTPLDPTLLAIHQRLKKHFDPAGILNPGRMYPGI